jgi:hypothetical protein
MGWKSPGLFFDRLRDTIPTQNGIRIIEKRRCSQFRGSHLSFSFSKEILEKMISGIKTTKFIFFTRFRLGKRRYICEFGTSHVDRFKDVLTKNRFRFFDGPGMTRHKHLEEFMITPC